MDGGHRGHRNHVFVLHISTSSAELMPHIIVILSPPAGLRSECKQEVLILCTGPWERDQSPGHCHHHLLNNTYLLSVKHGP